MSIIQQLEDLKEWAQNPERYERRLAFRGNLPSTEAGTIPIEWDELSDREQEYYRTGPWSTREDYSKGQLVQPGPGRPGYKGPPGKDYYEPKAFEWTTDPKRVGKKGGYRLSISRGDHSIDRSFSVNKYGSKEKARIAAEKAFA